MAEQTEILKQVATGCGHLDIFEIAADAWALGAPQDWLPFIEDNSDYFCISEAGVVRYWSHNGSTDESWPDFATGFEQVCIARA
ncbi:SMI1/KNR4 family protein [Pseudomonas sp. CAM1A]|uniref:SMI1/KNR4 family protein n=1 Tax=Pseudomonas sp. CAM1A TaxID=3231717 RepID=UPI0039C74CE7